MTFISSLIANTVDTQQTPVPLLCPSCAVSAKQPGNPGLRTPEGTPVEDVPGFDFTSRTTLHYYNLADQWLTWSHTCPNNYSLTTLTQALLRDTTTSWTANSQAAPTALSFLCSSLTPCDTISWTVCSFFFNTRNDGWGGSPLRLICVSSPQNASFGL